MDETTQVLNAYRASVDAVVDSLCDDLKAVKAQRDELLVALKALLIGGNPAAIQRGLDILAKYEGK